eukprot:scaffold16241_cov80-Skeletonema_dohrnii-CCMP3373.AAC.4
MTMMFGCCPPQVAVVVVVLSALSVRVGISLALWLLNFSHAKDTLQPSLQSCIIHHQAELLEVRAESNTLHITCVVKYSTPLGFIQLISTITNNNNANSQPATI